MLQFGIYLHSGSADMADAWEFWSAL